MSHVTAPQLSQARAQYDADGFTFGPQVLEAGQLQRIVAHMDDVVAGEYETGEKPLGVYDEPTRQPTKLVKIDQPQLADDTIREAVSSPALGQWVADFFDAEMVQVWAVQLLVKPPTKQSGGNVGWHQDMQYWSTWFTPESEIFTAWLAISDVTSDMGPMIFARGSHRWEGGKLLGGGDFFGQDQDMLREQIPVPKGETWEEVQAVMPPGAFSMHHRYTFHGSGPNLSNHTRRSFAIHLRTEKSQALTDSNAYYGSNLDNEAHFPVIFRR